MVDVKELRDSYDDFPYFEITDPDTTGAIFTVKRKDTNYTLYGIAVSKGSLPKELEGLHTKATDAIAKVKEYIGNRQVTTAYRAKVRKDKEEESLSNA